MVCRSVVVGRFNDFVVLSGGQMAGEILIFGFKFYLCYLILLSNISIINFSSKILSK